MMTEQPRTPWQTPGPYLAMALDWPDGPQVVPDGTLGALLLSGTLCDGDGAPIPNGLIEIWQADAAGRFDHQDDPRGRSGSGFRGFGRCITDQSGRYWFRTVKPGTLPYADGLREAPHLTVSICTRGLLRRVVTRVYFPDSAEANDRDPLLGRLAVADRELLVACPAGEHALRWDITLQGSNETPFFDL
jgi:protocatechuate 3,4-dioxygenase alpha subunit